MPRKKSIKKSAEKFTASVEEIEEFFQGTKSLKEDLSIWCAEYAVIRLYCEFEVFNKFAYRNFRRSTAPEIL